MLVKRKYLSFEDLLKDVKAKELYEKVTKSLNNERLYEATHTERFLKYKIVDKNQDWGLPGKFIQEIEDGLEQLDKEFPYDTELPADEINHMEFVTDPNGISYLPYLIGFYNIYPDGPKRLVTIINLEEENGKFKIADK